MNGWHIEYNPKPIPNRGHDYNYWHDDEDGTGMYSGTAASVAEAEDQIAEDDGDQQQ